MSYTINTTSNNILLTLLDGTTDSSTGLTLIGRNYTNYGLLQNDNFVRLLENFADNIPPGQSVGFNPITGTLWYDTANQVLKVYDGINFNVVSGRIVSSATPTAKNVGDQWYNTVTGQLSMWSGSNWQLLGPAYTAAQGKSGALVESVTGTDANTYTVVNTYTNGNLVTVTSTNTFTPTGAVYNAFASIVPGVNLANTGIVTGTATNSLQLANVAATAYARTDINASFVSDVSVGGNFVLTNANIYYASGSLNLKNQNLNGNIALYVNSGTNTNVLTVNGSTGLITVAGDPTNNLGVSTKQYVDTSVGTITSTVNGQIATQNASISTLRSDYFANISAVQTGINSNVNTLQSQTIANTNALSAYLTTNVSVLVANINTINANLGAVIYTTIPTLAPIISPNFTGTPTAPTSPGGDATANVATTAFVANVYTTLNNAYNSAITQEVTNRNTAISASVSGLAPIANPTFTGAPKAPTPGTGDVSTNIATTAFVSTAVTNATVSLPHITYGTTPPLNGTGNNGDFYFQYV